MGLAYYVKMNLENDESFVFESFKNPDWITGRGSGEDLNTKQTYEQSIQTSQQAQMFKKKNNSVWF